jgi:hypothetical protein
MQKFACNLISLFSVAYVGSNITHLYFIYMFNGRSSMFRLLKYSIKKLCSSFHKSRSSAPLATMVL